MPRQRPLNSSNNGARTIELADREVRERLESTLGEVDRVGRLAGGAGVRDGRGHRLAVGLVGDEQGLAAVLGRDTGRAVEGGVERDDLVGLSVDRAARTGDTVLVEPGGPSEVVSATGEGRLGRI